MLIIRGCKHNGPWIDFYFFTFIAIHLIILWLQKAPLPQTKEAHTKTDTLSPRVKQLSSSLLFKHAS